MCKEQLLFEVISITMNLLLAACILGFIQSALAPFPNYTPGFGSWSDKSRDALVKSYFRQNYSNKEILLFLSTVHGLILSLSHLKRTLRRLNLRRRIAPTNHALERAIAAIEMELQGSGACLGYKSMWRRLKMKGIAIPRNVVRVALSMLDPQGVESRRKKRLRRRRYLNPGPNFVWHIDGYDKLKPYGFAIHGAIDGFSRRMMWLNVGSSNNNPTIIAKYYLETVLHLKTLPCLVRGDRGTENVHVCRIQRYLRADHTDSFSGNDSFVYGKSTSNQRIESWWCVLRKQGISFWMNLFKDMIAAGLLDTSDVIHIHALRFCFMELIQWDLSRIAMEWNQHRIETRRNAEGPRGKPDVLYFTPQYVDSESYGIAPCLDDAAVVFNELDADPSQKPDIDPTFVELVNGLLPNLDEPNDPSEGLLLYSKILEAIATL